MATLSLLEGLLSNLDRVCHRWINFTDAATDSTSNCHRSTTKMPPVHQERRTGSTSLTAALASAGSIRQASIVQLLTGLSGTRSSTIRVFAHRCERTRLIQHHARGKGSDRSWPVNTYRRPTPARRQQREHVDGRAISSRQSSGAFSPWMIQCATFLDARYQRASTCRNQNASANYSRFGMVKFLPT